MTPSIRGLNATLSTNGTHHKQHNITFTFNVAFLLFYILIVMLNVIMLSVVMLPSNIRLGWKGLPVTNALAYYKNS